MRCIPDRFNLFGISFLKSFEDEYEHLFNQLKNFMIMLLKRHFQIQPNELREMTMGKTVFCTEDRSDFKNPFKIRGNKHLLIELRRLSEICRAIKIGDFENICSTLRCSS